MRKLPTVFGALLILASLLFSLPSGKASAFAQQAICAGQGQGLCLNLKYGINLVGQPYVTFLNDDDNNEQMAILFNEQNLCGNDIVSARKECPFTSRSGLNREFNNSAIMELKDTYTGNCVGAAGPSYDATSDQHCNGVGSVWIESGESLISRPGSDEYGSADYLCSTGYSGNQAVIQTRWESGYCQWSQN